MGEIHVNTVKREQNICSRVCIPSSKPRLVKIRPERRAKGKNATRKYTRDKNATQKIFKKIPENIPKSVKKIPERIPKTAKNIPEWAAHMYLPVSRKNPPPGIGSVYVSIGPIVFSLFYFSL